MAHLLAQGTSREAEATGRELARVPSSRSSFERVGHEVGTLYRRAQARIEEVLIQEYRCRSRTALSPRSPGPRRSHQRPGNAQHRGADVRISGGKTRNGSDEDQCRMPDSAMKSKY